jgi:hypothetical protein
MYRRCESGNARHALRAAGVSLVLLFLAGQPAKPQTIWSAVADFTIASNPNGAWSYGWEGFLGAPFSIYTVTDTTSVPGIDAWLESGTYPFNPPYVARNVTTKTICYETYCVPVTYLHFHPASNGQYSVVRWTAPGAGVYTLGGAFVGLDYGGPTSTDVHVVVNSKRSLFSGEVSSYGAPLPFRATIALHAGDTVDFAVGFGSDGNYNSDSTGIRCVIRLR